MRGQRGFTLIEVLVAASVMLVMVILLCSLITRASSVWRDTGSKLEQFREARTAFESMSLRLSQATLATYWGYDYKTNASSIQVPKGYIRRSELRFISGSGIASVNGGRSRPTHAVFFNAPLGMVENDAEYGNLPGLLNLCGYYVEWSRDDEVDRPTLLPPSDKSHFRNRLS